MNQLATTYNNLQFMQPKENALNESKANPIQKNLGLTQVEFQQLVQALQNGDEHLIEHVYLAHFQNCTNYLIKQCGAKYEQAYSSTMDALLEIRKDLVENKIQYGNLAYYFTYRAKKKLYKRQNKASAKLKTTNIEGLDFEGNTNIALEFQTKEMKVLILNALKDLCEDCRNLLRLHYYEELSLAEIATLQQKKPPTVRQQAKRCRAKFRNILEKMLG